MVAANGPVPDIAVPGRTFRRLRMVDAGHAASVNDLVVDHDQRRLTASTGLFATWFRLAATITKTAAGGRPPAPRSSINGLEDEQPGPEIAPPVRFVAIRTKRQPD